MWETIRGYLTFTRKERYGVLFLLLLVSILFVLPYFSRPSAGDPDPAAYENMKEGIRKFEARTADSAGDRVNHRRYTDIPGTAPPNNTTNVEEPIIGELFYFDPNRNSASDWQRLGLTQQLSKTILKYIEKGGRFRKAEDLQKIYGLNQAGYERLFPYVRLSAERKTFRSVTGYHANANYDPAVVRKTDSLFRQRAMKANPDAGFTRSAKKFSITDINEADSAVWSALPGIGEKLASRIMRFREKLGGFYQVEQVGETFGLPDTCFQKIKPFLRLNSVSLRLINLNKTSREELQSHPYIRWQIARQIMDYRRQHGDFKSVEELLQLVQISDLTFQKMKPYLVVQP